MEDVLQKVQDELKVWSYHNFGDRPSWQPLLGIQEELGELSHSYLKREQGIRIEQNHTAAIKDACADIVIFLLDFCNNQNINLSKTLLDTWNEVKKRDWRKYPVTGVPEPELPCVNQSLPELEISIPKTDTLEGWQERKLAREQGVFPGAFKFKGQTPEANIQY